jgi:hypothetical protein
MEYLIIDYSDVTKEDSKNQDFSKRKCYILSESELFDLLNKSKEDGEFPDIAIYKLGDCIIDWT